MLASVDFVELHAPNGARLYVNPMEITSVREPAGDALHHFARGTRCVLVMANAQFNAVRESCDRVLQLLGRVSRAPQ